MDSLINIIKSLDCNETISLSKNNTSLVVKVKKHDPLKTDKELSQHILINEITSLEEDAQCLSMLSVIIEDLLDKLREETDLTGLDLLNKLREETQAVPAVTEYDVYKTLPKKDDVYIPPKIPPNISLKKQKLCKQKKEKL